MALSLIAKNLERGVCYFTSITMIFFYKLCVFYFYIYIYMYFSDVISENNWNNENGSEINCCLVTSNMHKTLLFVV